jgi:hypothetical protein
VNNYFGEGKDAWFNMKYWTVSYMGYCEKPRKMPASIAGVSAEIRTGNFRTNPEALPLGGLSDSPVGRCSCRYGACLRHAVLCLPCTMLDVLPLYCVSWPGLVPFQCPLILLVSVLLPASPHSRKCWSRSVAGMGRWLTHTNVLGNCTLTHEELGDATSNFDKQIRFIPTYCKVYAV